MGACAVPQSHVDDPQKPKDMPRPCAMCGFPMFLTLVEPADKPNHDRRFFQCAKCAHSEIVVVKYK
jgi:hypothetical protein